jgi:ABC-type uncharacterized transport system fused permease/ATPase subunit
MDADALLESLISIVNSLSYDGSTPDFILIMRLSGILWNRSLEWAFLEVRVSRLSVGSFVLIILGYLTIGDIGLTRGFDSSKIA